MLLVLCVVDAGVCGFMSVWFHVVVGAMFVRFHVLLVLCVLVLCVVGYVCCWFYDVWVYVLLVLCVF